MVDCWSYFSRRGCIDLQSNTGGQTEVGSDLIFIAECELVFIRSKIGWLRHNGLSCLTDPTQKKLGKGIPGIINSRQSGQLAVKLELARRIFRQIRIHLAPEWGEV